MVLLAVGLGIGVAGYLTLRLTESRRDSRPWQVIRLIAVLAVTLGLVVVGGWVLFALFE